MSNYLNNLLTTTTSKYTTLRRQLLSDEADGDTEDDSHMTRVLRAYYTEKGRPFPQWLPPDPRAPQAAPAQMVSSVGRGYGNMNMGQQQQQQMGRDAAGGGGLGDLWDAPSQAPPQQQQNPNSLRRAQGRGGGGLRPGNTRSPEPQVQGRPLPSQRAGSQQSMSSSRAEPPQSQQGGGTAQDRLKARLWGGGKPQGASSQNPSPAPSPAPSSMRGQYDRPQGGGGRSQYSDERGGGGYSGGGGGGGGGGAGRYQNDYNTSANSPWAGNDDPYGPSYNNTPPQQSDRRRIGLPSGPRMR